MDSQIRSAWLASLLSTEPADRPRAESELRDLYAAAPPAGLPPPVYCFWFDSPFRAALAVALLKGGPYRSVVRILEGTGGPKPDRETMESIRSALCQRAQLDWDSLTAVLGGPAPILHQPMTARRQLHNKLNFIHTGDTKDDL